jgi:hypothetical protein
MEKDNKYGVKVQLIKVIFLMVKNTVKVSINFLTEISTKDLLNMINLMVKVISVFLKENIQALFKKENFKEKELFDGKMVLHMMEII